MIVADTGAIVALIDASDRYHDALRALYRESGTRWVLPWAILPEVDYLVATHISPKAAEAFFADLANGIFLIEWGRDADLRRAQALNRKYRTMQLGLVDAAVIAIAERFEAEAIVTLDMRHFGTVDIKGRPALWPRDAPAHK